MSANAAAYMQGNSLASMRDIRRDVATDQAPARRKVITNPRIAFGIFRGGLRDSVRRCAVRVHRQTEASARISPGFRAIREQAYTGAFFRRKRGRSPPDQDASAAENRRVASVWPWFSDASTAPAGDRAATYVAMSDTIFARRIGCA